MQLIDDLLDMRRIIAGKIRLDVRTVHLEEVLDAAIDRVRPAAEARGIRMQKIFDPRSAPVLGDFGRLQQVFALLKTFQPTVLISDIGMPVKDGYQLIREVRALSASDGANVPAVAVTALARIEDRRRALLGRDINLTWPSRSMPAS